MWWKESVVYQIYPRSFKDSNGDGIGDIRGIIEKLDYLHELGVDVIWLSPIYDSPNDDMGYDIRDYRKIGEEFGTMEDWEELRDGLHRRGMKLMMDLVVNHTSDEHYWFVQSRQSRDNPYREYYVWRDGRDGREPNNWVSFFSGSAWQYDELTGQYYLHLFSKKQPDLNWENPRVREEVYEMMTWWLERGVDGFRMDVINLISKVQEFPDAQGSGRYEWGGQFFMNGPRVHEFIREMNQRVLSKYDLITVGEAPGVTPEEAIRYASLKGDELHMIFQFEHMDVDSGNGKWDVQPLQLVKLKQVLSKWQMELHGQAWNSLYWNNHDQPRVVSRFGNDGRYRVQSAKMLAATLHMMQGTPYIYQGEEIGMTNVKFPSIDDYRDIETLNMYREAVNEGGSDHDQVMRAIYAKGRDNARTPMQWNRERHGGFTTGEPWLAVNPNFTEINVEQALQDEDSILHFYRRLIRLRKQHKIIIEGSYELILPDDEQIFAYLRRYGDEVLLVVSNFTEEEPQFRLPDEVTYVRSTLLIGNYPDADGDSSAFVLRSYETRVYLLQR